MEEQNQVNNNNNNETKKVKTGVTVGIILAVIFVPIIIVALVIMGLGAIIVNNASQVIKEASIEESSVEDTSFTKQEINTFNSKFESYEGTNVSGSNVKALANIVIVNNNYYPELQVDVYFNGIKVYDLASSKSTITAGNKYTVEMKKDSSGRINRINIKSNV